MSDAAVEAGQSVRSTPVRAVALMGLTVAAGLAIASRFGPEVAISAGLVVGLAMIAGYGIVRASGRTAPISGRSARLASFIEDDPVPRVIASSGGVIDGANAAARSLTASGESVTAFLKTRIADPGELFERLSRRAEATGGGSEDVVTRRGRLRVSVQSHRRVGLLWRMEDISAPAERGPEAGGSLPMLTVTGQGTVLYMNDALRRITGRRAKNIGQLFEGDPKSQSAVTLLGTDGPVRCRVHRIDAPGGRTEIHLLADVEESADSGFEDMPVALLRLGRGGHVIDANRLAREAFGGELDDSAYLSSLLDGLGRSVSDWVDDAIAGRSKGGSEVLRVRGSGADTFLQVTLGRTDGTDGADLVAVLHDATELKTLEGQFVQSQKMQAIGQLAGGVAHDFNNLLTAISGHCDLLLLKHDQGDADHADLVQIAANANRAAGLVRQLLAFSRKQTLTPEMMDLHDTLTDMTHLLNRLVGEKVTLTVSHDPELRPIRADRRQLEQVLMNLVVNARDALPDGGDIRVETANMLLTEPMRRDRVEVPVGSYVCLRVIDRGHGIPADKLAKIFEPFFTTKGQSEGTGLGLSTAYGIVKQTGGFIFVDSDEGVGTTFTLLFPAHARTAHVEPEARAALPAPSNAPLGEGVVLLVEDEAPVRAFAARALGLRGYDVIEADSAEAALELLANGDLRIDIFVTDVIMPGMDGPTWVRRALEDRPGTRVIFMSGYAEDALDDADSIPNSMFLPKPFSLSELATSVQTQLSSRAADASPKG